MVGKRTKGRKTIEMKRIENKDDCLITFSKRRSGIYKKASELVTLCGAEVVVVTFSPAGKPFSFAYPSIESVANRLLNEVGSNQMRHQGDVTDRHDDLVEAHRRLRINEVNQKYEELFRQLEYEKERGKVLQMVTDARGSQRGWWEIPVELLNFQELQQMKSLGMLYKKVCTIMKNKRSHGGQVAFSSFGLMQVDRNNFSAFHPGRHDHHGNFQ